MGLSDLQLSALSLQQLFEAVCSANTGAAVSGFTAPAAGIGAQDIALGLMEAEYTVFRSGDDAGALSGTLEQVMWAAPKRAMVVAAQLVPTNATGLTAATVNYAQVNLNCRQNGTGTAKALGTTATLPTANGGTGNWTQWNAVALNVTAFDPANTVINAGDSLTFSVNKIGSGVVVPAFSITARVRFV